MCDGIQALTDAIGYAPDVYAAYLLYNVNGICDGYTGYGPIDWRSMVLLFEQYYVHSDFGSLTDEAKNMSYDALMLIKLRSLAMLTVPVQGEELEYWPKYLLEECLKVLVKAYPRRVISLDEFYTRQLDMPPLPPKKKQVKIAIKES